MNFAAHPILLALPLAWLLVSSQALAASPKPDDTAPSFSCAQASGAAQKAICQDPMLAALDRENARLYASARTTPGLDAQRSNDLKATQRGWIKGRDDCWKADDLKACIRNAYVERIAEMRAGYAGARAPQQGSQSVGPVAVRCPDGGSWAATFVNVEPSLVLLSGSGRNQVLTIARSGSGARYTAATSGGEATFWQKGPQALLQWPGGKEQTCSVAVGG